MSRVVEIFWRFLFLGCVSFGGPAAHIGYFNRVFVGKLKWLDEASYVSLVALSQFLPGPGSSQVGFAIGFRRAGLMGGVAAFLGFTLPSFILLYLLATTVTDKLDVVMIAGVIHGLKLLAVVVVADATLTMFRAFCRDRIAIILALLMAVSLLFLQSLWVQVGGLMLAAIVGMFCWRGSVENSMGALRGSFKWWPLLLFLLLLLALPLLAFSWAEIVSPFYRAGSFVFGGGHVVLPLLQQAMGEAVPTDRLLLSYAAAQAVPGPMFSLAAFLGAEISPSHPLQGALLATIGVFLPGFLLLLSLESGWQVLAAKPRVAGAVWGVNAAVVGLLMAALYQPVFVSAVLSGLDMVVVILGFCALRVIKLPIVLLVVLAAALGGLLV
ncbi:chromate transporter [Sinobacterium caligoides]|uniref:Chromate transporter n=1 Tax=Sinobacterium caligoides TaxID=933926 RepID=A0A3N2DY34_9GAMM|nr:chromate efflux transporter [Sinobacterium caligoides]ROS04697.1 chromate transporter [Sinobacterium caligoides]